MARNNYDLDDPEDRVILGIPNPNPFESLRPSAEIELDYDRRELFVNHTSAPRFYTTYAEIMRDNNILKHKLGTYGVCVVEGVIEQGEVVRLQRETWEMVTEMLRDMRDPNTGVSVPFDINNPDSWFAINDIGSFHAYLIKNYGIGQSDVSWQLRRNQRVRNLYEILYGTEHLIVSMDSMGIRPGPPREKTKGGKDSTQGEFKNTSWLHTDQGPNRNINTVQSFVSLYDSEQGDPTLHAWPGTHFDKLHRAFWDDFAYPRDKKRGDFMKVEESHLLNPFNETDNDYNFDVIPKNPGEDDQRKEHSKKINAYADWKNFDPDEWYDPRRDPHIGSRSEPTGPVIINQFEWLMKQGFRPYAFGHTKGSVIMWDSRVFHEGGSPLKENKQSKRIVSYVCYLPLSMQTIDPAITRAQQIAILEDRKKLYLQGSADPHTRGEPGKKVVVVNATGDINNKGATTSHHPYNYVTNKVRPQGGPIVYNSTKVRALQVRQTVIDGPVLELEKRLVYGGDQYLAALKNLPGNDAPPAKRRKVGLSQKRRKRRSRSSRRSRRGTRRRRSRR